MKKRKFNLLLEIATLCLCVAAIAFGVYSAKNASLNVSGTVGFTAHNCDVYVAGKITGGIDADLKSITKFVSNATGATEDTFKSIGESYNWNIGTMYFDDINATGDEIAEPITITLKVYNKSAFDVTFKFNENFLPREHLNVVVDNSTIVMSANETEAKAHELKVTITLKDESFTEAVISGDTSLGNFAKYVSPYYISPIVETLVASSGKDQKQPAVNKLCMTLGHSIVGETAIDGTDGLTETPLVWYAFAVKGNQKIGTNEYSEKPTDIFNDTTTSITTPITTTSTYTNSNNETITETWYSLYNVDMSKVSDYKNHTYWFIQQYVVAGGYKLNDSDSSDQKGILFNPDTGENYNNTYAQVDNGKKSTIYTYLESEYATKTGVTEEEPSGIESRVVNEKYKVNKNYTNTTTENWKYYLSCQFTSKYWLLNHKELGLLCNKSIGLEDYGNYYKAYGISNQDGDSKGYGATWWLRSPYADSYGAARCVGNSGGFNYASVSYTPFGVRAAFQIQI